jgi:hypothetical protein
LGKHCRATILILTKDGLLACLRRCLNHPGFRPVFRDEKAWIATARDAWGHADLEVRAFANRQALEDELVRAFESHVDGLVAFGCENHANVTFDVKPPKGNPEIRILLPEAKGFKRIRANGIPDANHDIDFCMEAIGDSPWFHGIEWSWTE